MTAAEADGEPEATRTFVPLWADEADAEPAPVTLLPAGRWVPVEDDEPGPAAFDEDEAFRHETPLEEPFAPESVSVEPLPEPEPPRDATTGAGALPPEAPEPVVEARRTERQSTPDASSAARWALAKLRAMTGLLLLVVLSGVGLAAAVGVTVAVLALALRTLVGG